MISRQWMIRQEASDLPNLTEHGSTRLALISGFALGDQIQSEQQPYVAVRRPPIIIASLNWVQKPWLPASRRPSSIEAFPKPLTSKALAYASSLNDKALCVFREKNFALLRIPVQSFLQAFDAVATH
jgi:hypothetical protein